MPSHLMKRKGTRSEEESLRREMYVKGRREESGNEKEAFVDLDVDSMMKLIQMSLHV